MVDLLEKENPQIFRSKNKKFIDLYTKSGLFITEIITRLFNGIKDQIPDEHQRLKWIIENQVYAVAPTNIIYNIAKNFIMGNFEGISDKNIVEYDLTKAAEKGKVAEKLNELYGGKNLKFDVVIGNPPYQETISKHSGNKSLAKQLFPMFTKEAIELNSRYVSLIIPARWFAGDAQDKSFVRLREYLRQNNHIKQMYYFEDAREIFPNVEIKGGVCYFLYDKEYNGTVNFYNSLKGKVLLTKRNLFVDDLDIILTSSIDLHILEKVLSSKFTSLTSITKGRNAFGIIGKDEHVASISEDSPFDGSCELRCKFNEIRYIKPELVQKNKDIFENYKVFISKSAGAPGKDKKVIGYPYVGLKNTACTDSLIPIGNFDNEIEAINLQKYLKTKFLRYLVSIVKSSQNVTQIVYRFVPLQDFTPDSDIDWTKSASQIDQKLYEKYGLSDEEIQIIEETVESID